MQVSHYYESLMVSEMRYFRMGPFDLKVVLHQLNRGINHLLRGSQTLFAYNEFNFSSVFFSKMANFRYSGTRVGRKDDNGTDFYFSRSTMDLMIFFYQYDTFKYWPF